MRNNQKEYIEHCWNELNGKTDSIEEYLPAPKPKKQKRSRNHPYLKILLFAVLFYVIYFYARTLVNFPVTVGLIGINVIVFILVKMKKCHVMNLGTSYDFTQKDRQYYRVVTSAFTHEEPLHILCNMISMYNIGTVLEPVLGTKRFVIMYIVILIVGGCIACLGHQNHSPHTISIGASGTICGLLGIYIALVVRIAGLAGLRSVLPTIGMLFVMTFSKKIDSIGHFSGLLVGIVCGYVLTIL